MSKPLPPVDRHALALQTQDVETTLNRLRDQLCTTPEARVLFAELMNMSHQKHADFTSERQELTKPLKSEIASIEEPYRPLLKALDALKTLSKQKVSEFDTAQLRLAEEARTRAVIAAQAGKTEECALALAEVPDVSGSFEYGFTVTDLAQVDRKFLKLDEAAVKEFLKPMQNSNTVPQEPGLEFFKRVPVRASKGR